MTSITSDHDLLVGLTVKLDALSTDVKELKDGVHAQISDHEIRVRRIEDLIKQTDAPNAYTEFVKLKEDVRDFKVTANIYRTLAGLVGGAVFFALSQLPNWIKTFLK